MRNTNLDILRIIAIFSVVVCHLGSYFPFFSSYCSSWGKHGVQLLLILSGYLAFYSLDMQGSHGYYRRRIKRLIPLYWLVLIMEFGYEMLYAMIHSGDSFMEFLVPDGLSFGRYFLCLQLVIPSDNWDIYNNRYALWTMSALAVFYLTAPILYKLVNRYWSAQLLSILLLVFHRPMIYFVRDSLGFLPESGHAGWFAEMTPINYMYCFFLGIVVFYAIKENKEFLFSIVIIALMFYEPLERYKFELLFALTIMLACISPVLLQKGWMKEHIINLATKSYAIYLVHLWVIKMCDVFLNGIFHLDNLGIQFLITVICIFAISYGAYELVQRVDHRYRRRIVDEGKAEN